MEELTEDCTYCDGLGVRKLTEREWKALPSYFKAGLRQETYRKACNYCGRTGTQRKEADAGSRMG